jgi:hypothetical protein
MDISKSLRLFAKFISFSLTAPASQRFRASGIGMPLALRWLGRGDTIELNLRFA